MAGGLDTEVPTERITIGLFQHCCTLGRDMPCYTGLVAETIEKIDWSELLDQALTREGKLSNVYNRFYEYSFLNQMLLAMQGVYEPVATYKRWQDMDRQVVRGAQARSILRPIIIKDRAAKGETVVEDGQEPEGARLVGFKLVRCLFPLSETTGKELPPAPEFPGWNRQTAEERLGISRIPFDISDGNVMGYSVGLRYAINPLNPTPDRTAFHEYAHIVRGDTLPSLQDEYRQHRGRREVVAESIAYLCMHQLGVLDDETALHSRGYIQDWRKGETLSDESVRDIFRTTDAILRAGRPAVPAEAQPDNS